MNKENKKEIMILCMTSFIGFSAITLGWVRIYLDHVSKTLDSLVLIFFIISFLSIAGNLIFYYRQTKEDIRSSSRFSELHYNIGDLVIELLAIGSPQNESTREELFDLARILQIEKEIDSETVLTAHLIKSHELHALKIFQGQKISSVFMRMQHEIVRIKSLRAKE